MSRHVIGASFIPHLDVASRDECSIHSDMISLSAALSTCRYNYERLQMALHESEVHRFMAFGASGISIVADSLAAIKYATVTPVRARLRHTCLVHILV